MHSEIRPSASMPGKRNKPAAILSAWTALEVLSPKLYNLPQDLVGGKKNGIAWSDTKHPLPWTVAVSLKEKEELFYRVVLGSIRMGPAMSELVKVFGDDEARGSHGNKKAVAIDLLLNREGIVVAENAVSFSSFVWGLPLALKRRFDDLASWSVVDEELKSELDRIVRRVDDEGRSIPLDLPTMELALQWLVKRCEVPEGLIEKQAFVLRHVTKSKEQPDALVLNSFLLRDLERVATCVENQTAPESVLRYLGAVKRPEPLDLLRDSALLEEAVAPALIPAATWPSGQGKSLVMLQQAAVNLARRELGGKQGLFAVNGPPGTGKTTLLREVVAMCVLDRATAMSTFDNPNEAFVETAERISFDSGSFSKIYTVDPLLRGHEILVASSNNKAVENVTKELPARGAVAYTSGELNYFKSISDLVHGSRKEDKGGDTIEISPEPVETWGLIAAVLGNKTNRSAFWAAFWWDDDRGFKTYLKAASGKNVLDYFKHPDRNKGTTKSLGR